MITVKITKTLAKFEELKPADQAYLIDKNRDINVSDVFWYECLIDEFKEVLGTLGFYQPRVYFSHSYSQGDGACFECSYFSYEKGMVKKIKSLSKDKELIRITKELQALYRKCFYDVAGKVVHRGHYYHENSMVVYLSDWFYKNNEFYNVVEEGFKEICRDLSCWMFGKIRNEYEYQTSGDEVRYSLDNDWEEYEIDEDGDLIR